MHPANLQEFLDEFEVFLLCNLHLLDDCHEELVAKLRRFVVFVACKAYRDGSRQIVERLRRVEPC